MLHFASFCNFYSHKRPGTLLGMSRDIFESPSNQNFWHKRQHCSWSPLVPICWTMLLFSTFIDTRGLKHCWKSYGTFWESPSNPIFWHKRRHCRQTYQTTSHNLLNHSKPYKSIKLKQATYQSPASLNLLWAWPSSAPACCLIFFTNKIRFSWIGEQYTSLCC